MYAGHYGSGWGGNIIEYLSLWSFSRRSIASIYAHTKLLTVPFMRMYVSYSQDFKYENVNYMPNILEAQNIRVYWQFSMNTIILLLILTLVIGYSYISPIENVQQNV